MAPSAYGLMAYALFNAFLRTALPLLHFGFARGQCFLQQGHARPSRATAAAAFAFFFAAFFCLCSFELTGLSFHA